MEDHNYLKRAFKLNIFNRIQINETTLNSERIFFIYTWVIPQFGRQTDLSVRKLCMWYYLVWIIFEYDDLFKFKAYELNFLSKCIFVCLSTNFIETRSHIMIFTFWFKFGIFQLTNSSSFNKIGIKNGKLTNFFLFKLSDIWYQFNFFIFVSIPS